MHVESLHPLVRAILFGLLNSPLAALGREAMDRLSNGRPWKDDGEDVENDVSDDGGEPEFQAGALAPDPADPVLGLSQLAVLEAVVIGHLRRETEIAARLPALAERLGLKAVFVEGAPSSATRDGGGLLARDRTAAIKDFIDSFKETTERARRALERELQGRAT